MAERLGLVHRYAGTAREIGNAVRRALGARLEENIDRYIRERPQRPGALDLAALERGALPWLRTLPQRFQDELEGLAEGANLPLQRVAEWNYVEICVDDGCSGFVGRLGGHVWVARNNDTFVPDVWGYATLREVSGRIPTLCYGQEADVFTATGVNRDRLWLHHQFGSEARLPLHRPDGDVVESVRRLDLDLVARAKAGVEGPSPQVGSGAKA